MIIRHHIRLLLLLLIVSLTADAQSILGTGNWYKIAVEKNGVYKISSDLLKKMGIDPSKIDPRKISIHGYGGGMLPQSNNSPRTIDLPEIAIFVSGEDDGTFNSQDYILFYAEGPDKVWYDTQRKIFGYENNLYANKNFYFLTISEDDGKRVTTSGNQSGAFPSVNECDDYIFHEVDEYNELHSGREWFGEQFGLTTDRTLSFAISGIVENTEMKLVSDVMGQSYTSASFNVFFNNTMLVEQKVLPIPNARYAIKGQHKRDTVTFNSTTVNVGGKTSHDVRYQFVKGTGFSQGFLDFLLVSFKRSLALYNDQTIFTASSSLQNPVSQFNVASVPANVSVWDITNPSDAKIQEIILSGSQATFATSTDQLKNFIVFNDKVPSPEFVAKIENQNLHQLSTPNLIIVTHPTFLTEAVRLAEHRQSYSGWSVHVVTTDEVYHEFSSGRQDVTAIRDFVKYLHDKNPGQLKALLLFGKCSYDYRDIKANNTNFVATYESRNSLHPLQTYSSDDYFTFLEPSEGTWSENPVQNHTLDIGVGRLPVKNVDEAKIVVDKIMRYDSENKNFGRWRKEIVFVADDGNSEDGFTSLHQSQANALADFIENNNPEVDTRKLFMGTYSKTVRPSGETIPSMTNDIIRAFDNGALIINYTGHGNEDLWADERVFTSSNISELENDRYPFLVTATCEFGRHDNPAQRSSAELCVTRENGGAIAMVTTARPVNSTTNFDLNHAFYEALFERENGKYTPAGEVFRKTKNNSTSGVSNRNFSLLGDPSLMLALPGNTIAVTELKTATGSDTLKALSTVNLKGEIRSAAGSKLGNFNGTVEIVLFDKQTNFTTIGKNNPPFTFQQWHNALFRGQATVKEGEFTAQFVMPKNINYQVNYGKLSLYAFDPTQHIDAGGADLTFKIGKSESNIAADVTPPVIQLFMGDTTFVNGGVTTPDTYLVARLSDASGINISGYGIGNNIMAVLDNDVETFILNNYYIADKDDYTQGQIRYPLKDLTAGKHNITVKAWDTHNNPAEAKVDFIVTDGEAVVIEAFGNYPNPFRERTTVFFTHNRAGDDLQAQLFIYNLQGEVMKAAEFSIYESPYRVDLLELNAPEDFGKKLSTGLYLARLIVRSLSNSSKNEQVTKLIVLN